MCTLCEHCARFACTMHCLRGSVQECSWLCALCVHTSVPCAQLCASCTALAQLCAFHPVCFFFVHLLLCISCDCAVNTDEGWKLAKKKRLQAVVRDQEQIVHFLKQVLHFLENFVYIVEEAVLHLNQILHILGEFEHIFEQLWQNLLLPGMGHRVRQMASLSF